MGFLVLVADTLRNVSKVVYCPKVKKVCLERMVKVTCRAHACMQSTKETSHDCLFPLTKTSVGKQDSKGVKNILSMFHMLGFTEVCMRVYENIVHNTFFAFDTRIADTFMSC